MSNEPATARYYGRLLGLLSGLIAVWQVLVSVSSALANQPAIAALQHSVVPPYVGTVPSNLGGVGTVLIVTYLSAFIGGIAMMGFAWYAGRLTALTLGRRAAGGQAGFWVACWSGGIWLVAALIAAALAHADGTLTGVVASSPGGPLNVAQLILLALENGIAALIGLGLGALAGMIGARSARVSPAAASYPPLPPQYGAYPAGPGYPGYPAYWQPPGPSAYAPPEPYPPPPERYGPENGMSGEPTGAASDTGVPPS